MTKKVGIAVILYLAAIAFISSTSNLKNTTWGKDLAKLSNFGAIALHYFEDTGVSKRVFRGDRKLTGPHHAALASATTVLPLAVADRNWVFHSATDFISITEFISSND